MGEPHIQRSFAIQSLSVNKEFLTATISDGRVISIPITWFERLKEASMKQLQNFEISPSGYGIHWPEIDEDISIQSFISSRNHNFS